MTIAPFPTPAGFNRSEEASTDPRFGANPFIASGTQPSEGFYTPAWAGAASAVTGTNVVPGMTEEEAQTQTEQALAKLATVNPALAQQLIEQREGQESGGFLGFLGDVAGVIFQPALDLGGRALELISRTSHIVPQWFDPDDDGNWMQDIGQALSGEDKTTWSEVMENRGMFENQGWLRAGLGFLGDVATDPLTYATLGASAGVSTGTKAASAAATVATKGKFATRAAEIMGVGVDEGARFLEQGYKWAAGQVDEIAQIRNMVDGGADEFLGMVGRANDSELRALLADSWHAGAETYKHVYGRTWKSFVGRNGTMNLPGGGVLMGSDLKPLFEKLATGANFTKYGDGAWAAAKAASGAMGGLRFRFALPFTQFRFITPMVPGSWRLGFGSMGRFGAGLSGLKVASQFGTEAEQLFMEVGWDGLKQVADHGSAVVNYGRKFGARSTVQGNRLLAQQMLEAGRAGRAPFLRSAFYSGSELAGKVTAHLSPGARMYRRGLGYYFYRHGMKRAQDMRRRLTSDLFYSVDPSGVKGEKTKQDLMRRFDAEFGAKKTKLGHDQLSRARKYVDFFGGGGIPNTPEDAAGTALDQWFWHSTPQREEALQAFRQSKRSGGAPEATMEYLRQEAILKDMKATINELSSTQRKILDDITATEAYGKKTLERHGVDIGDARYDLDETGILHWEDIGLLGRRPDHLQQNYFLVIPEGVSRSHTKYAGVTPDHVTTWDDLGVEGVRVQPEYVPGSVPVQLNVRNTVDVHLEDFESATPATRESVTSGGASLPEILKAVDAGMDEQGEALAGKLHELFGDIPALRLEWDASSRAKLATEALKRRPNGVEAVRFFRDGKVVDIVVPEAKRVFAVSESAPRLLPKGGYFRRTLSKGLKAKLRGEGELGGRKIFGDPGRLEASFRRETRDMTLEEAEVYIRRKINDDNDTFAGITLAKDEPVFEWDIKAGHEDYVDYLGDTYMAVATGRLTQRMLDLGQLVPGHFGAVARTSRTRFALNQAQMKVIGRLDKKAANLAMKALERQNKLEAMEGQSLLDEHDRLATMIAYMDAGFTAEDIPLVRLVSAVDNVVTKAARLGKVVQQTAEAAKLKRQKLTAEEKLLKQVEDATHVTEWEDLDTFISNRYSPPAKFQNAEGVWVEDAVTPMSKAEQTHQKESLAKAQLEGRATDVSAPSRTPFEPIVWRVESSVRVADTDLPRRLYLVEDPVTGEILHVRELDLSARPGETVGVIAQTAKGQDRRGHGLRAILAHWRDEGVTDFASVKRVIGEDQSLSRSALGLNRKAARVLLREQGILDPETVRDLLERGKLYVGKDNSVLSKKGAYREGGRRVMSRTELQSQLDQLGQMELELDALRQEVLAAEGTSAQRQAAAGFAKGVEKAEAAVGQSVKAQVKATKRSARTIGRLREQLTRVNQELNTALSQSEKGWAEMRPAIQFDRPIEGGFGGMRPVQIPQLNGVYAHPYVAEELEYLFKGRPTGAFTHMYRQFLLGPWKRWATYRNPGFHARNFFGAWFNNAIGGVDAADHEFSRKIMMARSDVKDWATRPVENKDWNRYNFDKLPGFDQLKGKVTYGDLSEMLADMGIGRANTTAIAQTMGGDSLALKARGRIGGGFQKVDEKLRNTGAHTEDFFRGAAWAGGMRHMDGDLYGAHAFTMVRHGDYSDLTETEDKIRDLVPFYKWMRTNVPYQFRMLAENPGAYAAIDKAQTAVYEGMGYDREREEAKMPEWLKRGFNIPVPRGTPIIGDPSKTNYLMFDLPYADLYNGMREYLSSGFPVIRNIVESYGIEQSVFSGAPIGNKMVKPSGIFQAPGISTLLAATPWAQRGADGDIYIPDTVDNVLGAVPIYSRYRNWLSADPDRVENRTGTLLSALLGVGLRSEDMTAAELSFYYDELLPTMDRLKSMGYTFPSVDDMRDAGILFDEQTPDEEAFALIEGTTIETTEGA